MNNTVAGLSESEHVIDTADILTDLADAMQENTLHAFQQDIITQQEADQLNQLTNEMRHEANLLYNDAASYICAELEMAQIEIIETISNAKDAIKDMRNTAIYIKIATHAIAMLGAIKTANVSGIVNSVKAIKKESKNIT